MEQRFVETNRDVAVVWGGVAVLFGAGGSLLFGDAIADSVLFGLAMGLGFAIGVLLVFTPNT